MFRIARVMKDLSTLSGITSPWPKKCTGGFNLVIVPLSDGILTSIDRDNFNVAVDTEGRLILTRLDRKIQLVFDYDKGFMTGILGGVLYDTFEIPKHEGTDYHG